MKQLTKFIGFLIVSLFFLISSKSAFASIFFQDNFNDGSSSKWTFIGDPGWAVINGEYGVRLNPGLSNSIPTDDYWNNEWKNFVYEVDMRGIEGTDKNILIRFQNTSNWYGIHHTGGFIHFEKVVGGVGCPIVSPVSYPLLNNQTYHFFFRFEGKQIKIFVNGDSLFDFTDQNPILEYGKIGLRVGTGGDPVANVWFDNVVVTSLDEETPTPTPTLPTAVIFLPGLGASFNFKEMVLGNSDPSDWQMMPGANSYKNLQKAFEGNSNFYTFYYDWRKPVTESAQKLNNYIQNTVNPSNNKIDLIGHSLGGLVARTCVQKTENNCYADKLITIGSPNSGSVDAYPALEAGEVLRTGLAKLGYELLIHYHQKPGETKKDTIQRISPVLFDLLPDFDYLSKNGVNLPPSSLSIKNNLLPQLQDLSILENKTNTLSGRGFSLIEQIILTEPNWIDKLLGNWPDGKPQDKLFTLEGDSSILVKSSSFTDPLIKNFTYDLDHGGIVSEQAPLSKIMEILGLELNPGTYDSLQDEENYLVFFVYSPVKISSPDATEDTLFNNELIIIPNPQNKNYLLNLEGLENGFYKLSVGQIFGDKLLWNDYFGQTSLGKNEDFTFAINPQSPQNQPLLDPSGSSTKYFAESLLEELKSEINNLSLNKNRRKLLLIPLVLIKAEKPEESLISLYGFRKVVAVYEKNKSISSDKANLLRNKATLLSGYLETLAFLSPKPTMKNISDKSIKLALKSKSAIKIKKMTKNSIFVYQEADEKLTKAQENSLLGDYYKAKVYANASSSLFLEAKILGH